MKKLREVIVIREGQPATAAVHDSKVERALDAIQHANSGFFDSVPEMHELIMALVDHAGIPVAHQKRIKSILDANQGE